MVQDVQPKLTNGNVQAIMGKPTTKRRILSPASIWDELTLFPWLESRGIKTIHAHRIWKHLLKSGAKTLDNIEDVPDLPALLVGELKKDFVLSTSKVAPPPSLITPSTQLPRPAPPTATDPSLPQQQALRTPPHHPLPHPLWLCTPCSAGAAGLLLRGRYHQAAH